MTPTPPSEYELILLFMRAKDVEAVRAELKLENLSAEHEKALRDVAAVAFDRLHNRELGNKLHFKSGWLELFHQAVHEFHVLLRALYSMQG